MLSGCITPIIKRTDEVAVSKFLPAVKNRNNFIHFCDLTLLRILNHFNESTVLEFMRDAGALLSNLPALLVIVRSPTQVGKFASVFVQLLQQYLFNTCIHICSTRLSDLLFPSWRSRARPSSYLITQSLWDICTSSPASPHPT